MRAYRPDQPGGIEHLRLREEPDPVPQRGEVLVRVRATSLNYRDLLLLGGTYRLPGKGGLVPLSDAAGEVVALGPDVSRFAVGDRVINSFHPNWFGGRRAAEPASDTYGNVREGWLSEYRAVSENALVALPDSLSFEQGATLPCAAVTAWTALAGVGPSDIVLTQGTGGVSLFALQLAKLLGARVVATTSSAGRAERLRALGADDVIDYVAEPEWGKAVLDVTGGRGVDRIIEVGGPATFAQSLVAAGTHGAEIAVVGFLGEEGAPIGYMDLFRSGVSLRKVWVGSRGDTEELLRLLAVRRLEPVIDAVFPFVDAVEALRCFESRGNFGKIVIAGSLL